MGLLESPQSLLLAHYLKMLGGSRDLWMVLCHSLNAGLVVGGIPWHGGDTQSLPYAKEFVWTYCANGWWGCKNFGCEHPHPRRLLQFPLQYWILVGRSQLLINQLFLTDGLRGELPKILLCVAGGFVAIVTPGSALRAKAFIFGDNLMSTITVRCILGYCTDGVHETDTRVRIDVYVCKKTNISQIVLIIRTIALRCRFVIVHWPLWL